MIYLLVELDLVYAQRAGGILSDDYDIKKVFSGGNFGRKQRGIREKKRVYPSLPEEFSR